VAGQPAIQQLTPPQASSGNIQQSLSALDDIKATTSLFDASRGARSNETSGIAIEARKVQGNLANFAYSDNMVRAARYTYEILADMIPRIYTKERQEMIIGADGSERVVTINQTVKDKETGDDVIINDLSMGTYAVVVTVGPQYETRRKEFTDNAINLARFVPIVGQVGADLIVKNLDFVDSEELAERIRKTLPPGLTEDEESAPRQPQPPGPDEILKQMEMGRKQLEIEGKKLDLQEKQLDISTKTGDIQGLIEAATQAAVQGTLQKLGIIPPQQEKK